MCPTMARPTSGSSGQAKEKKMNNPNADDECRGRIIKALSESVEELSLSAHADRDVNATIKIILERIRFLAKEIK